MIVEEEVYLEHYGKKGMRWGYRTSARLGQKVGKAARKANSNAIQNVSRLDKESKEKLKAKQTKRVAAGKKKDRFFDKQANRDLAWVLGGFAGAAALTYLSSPHGVNMMSTTFRTAKSYANPSVDDILRRTGNVKVSDISNFVDVTSTVGRRVPSTLRALTA